MCGTTLELWNIIGKALQYDLADPNNDPLEIICAQANKLYDEIEYHPYINLD